MLTSLALYLATFFVTMAILLLLRPKKRGISYPPGPPPKPIIGNVLDLPLEKPWTKYLALSKEYNSDIIHFSIMNIHIIVLNNVKDAVELFEKRSTVYSSRPTFPITDLMEVGDLTPLTQYGSTWRKHRKLFQESLSQKRMPSYEHVQTEKVHLLLELLLKNPKGFIEHCKWLSTAITMATTFDYDVVPEQGNDRFVTLAEDFTSKIAGLIVPGSTLINVLPFLRYIPPWVPGAFTQRQAVEIRNDMNAYKNEPFEYVLKNLATGNTKECMLVNLLQRRNKVGAVYEDEAIMKSMIVTTYLGMLFHLHGPGH
ncbi:hypothetical protein AX15_001063 [Amanita polypyramis BW_CC]|nr:hypothetical protein AX15_001063 [Amanita polypyramis BW_CC]